MTRRALTAVLALAIASPAFAQGVGHFGQQQNGVVAQGTVSGEMGRCALKRDRSAAVRIVTVTGEQAYREATSRIRPAMIACLAGRPSATIDNVHLTGSIAEALLAENDGVLLERVAALAPTLPSRVKDGPQAWRASIACTVAAKPAEAATLLRAPAESAAEMAAFRSMLPALQECVPASGSVSIKPSSVRATVALVAYRQAAGIVTSDAAPHAANGND